MEPRKGPHQHWAKSGPGGLWRTASPSRSQRNVHWPLAETEWQSLDRPSPIIRRLTVSASNLSAGFSPADWPRDFVASSALGDSRCKNVVRKRSLQIHATQQTTHSVLGDKERLKNASPCRRTLVKPSVLKPRVWAGAHIGAGDRKGRSEKTKRGHAGTSI